MTDAKQIAELMAKVQEYEASFDLYDDACRRGREKWQKQDPEGRKLQWPDQANLICWLIERIDAADRVIAIAEQFGGRQIDDSTEIDEWVALELEITAQVIRYRNDYGD